LAPLLGTKFQVRLRSQAGGFVRFAELLAKPAMV
jgi:hypothetical protein